MHPWMTLNGRLFSRRILLDFIIQLKLLATYCQLNLEEQIELRLIRYLLIFSFSSPFHNLGIIETLLIFYTTDLNKWLMVVSSHPRRLFTQESPLLFIDLSHLIQFRFEMSRYHHEYPRIVRSFAMYSLFLGLRNVEIILMH